METMPESSAPRAATPTGRRLVASDIDGTLLRTGEPATPNVRHAVNAVLHAGHLLVLATGRSLIGAVPVGVQLGLDDTWIVASNGAITARLHRDRYELVEQHDVNAETAIRVALGQSPALLVAAEITGAGWRVSRRFPAGLLNGPQYVRPLTEVAANPTPRVAFHGLDAHRIVPALVAYGFTAIATRLDWIDVTAPGVSKATALEKVREQLGVESHNTTALGDGENDVEMLQWAADGIAMGHASPFVAGAANRSTGSLDDDGAASALWSLLS
ncbi:HAD family hydrolase [Promicromonospora sp. NPDC019610]|uniref:HAD family hydrolase n=1 Tax=Promicromonospora sp. NPDC019610 TaxID=3364405 RepID=UPI0037A75634